MNFCYACIYQGHALLSDAPSLSLLIAWAYGLPTIKPKLKIHPHLVLN